MSLRHLSRVCVRAIQGLREYTQKKSSNMMPNFKASQNRPRAEPTGSDQVRWVSSAAVEPARNSVIADEKRRIREAEKAEKEQWWRVKKLYSARDAHEHWRRRHISM